MKKLYLIFISTLFAGCASVKVQENSVDIDYKHIKPKVIYVQDFYIDNADWKLGERQGLEVKKCQEEVSTKLTELIVHNLSDCNIPIQKITGKPPKTGLLISGEFVTAKQGSRAARMLVGCGAGGTKLETKVYLYDLANSEYPFATFKTTGGSNAQPGHIFFGFFGSGCNAPGLMTDLSRTAREIAKFVKTEVL